MKLPIHSLRWRLQAWYGLILLVVLTAFCVAVAQLVWDTQLRRVDKQLFETERALMGGIMQAVARNGRPEGPDGKPLPPATPEEFETRLRSGNLVLPREVTQRFEADGPGAAYFFLRAPDGHVVLKSTSVPAGILDHVPVATTRGADVIMVGKHREAVDRMGDGMVLVIGRDITPERDDMQRFRISLAAAGLGVWLVGMVGGWWIAGRAIKPIDKISRTASRIAAGNYAERIDAERTDSELDQLSHVLNDTFDRLKATLDRQKQFTADASHELRTPVTILLSETRRILKRERTAQEYLDVIKTCESTGERMQRLIESLLLLAHQETVGPAAPERLEECDLAELAAAAIDHMRPLATERAIEIQSSLRSASCRGQPAALSILLNNLVANAIQHHREGGHVWVDTRTDRAEVVLTVRDDGPGIAPEHLPHLFGRFYRADKARTDSTRHSGLGLAIAKTIVENHRGQISVQSKPSQGAEFTVRLPAG